MKESRFDPIGFGGILGFVFLFFAIVGLGWFVYGMAQPRPHLAPSEMLTLDELFQRVIREAPVSDHFISGVGWDGANVSDQICPSVSPDMLRQYGTSSRFQTEEMLFAGQEEHLAQADVWTINENKDFFSICRDHSFRELSIEIQRETGICRAFVRPLPACDP